MINFKWGVFLNTYMVIVFLLSTALVSAQGQPKVDASLQIRSGLPNPGWIINDLGEIAQLQQFIDNIPNAVPVEPPTFGAFLLFSNEAISGFPQTVLVFNRVIMVEKADRTTEFFQDTKGLRGFLVNRAIQQGIEVPGVIKGDLDGDGDVDQDDINILLKDRDKSVSQSACGARCDFDGDGKITALDARKLQQLCTRPRCATK